VEKMNVGIFGGTFDPITRDHVRIAEHLIDEYICDNFGKKTASFDHRVAMCNLATKHNNKISVSLFDKKVCQVDGPNITETYNVLQYFVIRYTSLPQKHSFICGLDVAKQIPSWKTGPQLIDLLPHIVVDDSHKEHGDVWYNEKPHEVVEVPNISNLRSSVFKKAYNSSSVFDTQAISFGVYDYIIQYGLYKDCK
jgi:nicotinate (nicotinamide) nucleotide adenylyltransferase